MSSVKWFAVANHRIARMQNYPWLREINIVLLEYGAIRSPFPDITRLKYSRIMVLMTHIYDVVADDAIIAARIRNELELRGERIGEYDVLIAAQAIRTGSILVSNNPKHFDRVAGLHVIDWSVV
jgi:tRNA(fMet)-specific endonuclease VapC